MDSQKTSIFSLCIRRFRNGSVSIEEGDDMRKKAIWKLLLIVGVIPFVIPFVLGIYRMSIESWKLSDWLVLYSFVYWPTYLVGLVLIVVSIFKLIK